MSSIESNDNFKKAKLKLEKINLESINAIDEDSKLLNIFGSTGIILINAVSNGIKILQLDLEKIILIDVSLSIKSIDDIIATLESLRNNQQNIKQAQELIKQAYIKIIDME